MVSVLFCLSFSLRRTYHLASALLARNEKKNDCREVAVFSPQEILLFPYTVYFFNKFKNSDNNWKSLVKGSIGNKIFFLEESTLRVLTEVKERENLGLWESVFQPYLLYNWNLGRFRLKESELTASLLQRSRRIWPSWLSQSGLSPYSLGLSQNRTDLLQTMFHSLTGLKLETLFQLLCIIHLCSAETARDLESDALRNAMYLRMVCTCSRQTSLHWLELFFCDCNEQS